MIKASSLLFAVIVLVGPTACVSGDRLTIRSAPTPAFDPIAFFAGHTEGKGVLRVALHRPVPTLVEGQGQVTPDGSITLDQTVRRGDRSATRRQWRLRADGPGRFAGTLSDATGPVTGAIDGNRLHIAFAMKGGLQVGQWLYLEPGGRVAHNVMIVTKFGLPVARLDETIAKRPAHDVANAVR